jgi:hypothetical protein
MSRNKIEYFVYNRKVMFIDYLRSHPGWINHWKFPDIRVCSFTSYPGKEGAAEH